MSRHESEELSPDPDAVPSVHPSPDTGARKTQGGQRKRHGRFTQPLTKPERALFQGRRSIGPVAPAQAPGALHRRCPPVPPNRASRSIRKCFRQKSGPKPDRKAARRIARAARKRARGAKWAALYPEYIPSYQELNAVTRAYPEDGFRRKVNKHLQNHGRLRKAG